MKKIAELMTEKAVEETCYWDEGLNEVRIGIDKMQSAYKLRISSYQIAVDELKYEIGRLKRDNDKLKEAVNALVGEFDFRGIPLPDMNLPD